MPLLGYPVHDPDKINIEVIADADVCLYLAQKAGEARNWPLKILHCRKGLDLLQANESWIKDEDARAFVLSLRSELAYAEQRNANFPETLSILNNINISDLPSEKRLEIENLKALTLCALSQREEAIEQILELLESIGSELRTTPPQFRIEDLRSLPKMSQEDLLTLALHKTLGELIYTTRPDLHWPLICSEMIFCLEKGHSKYAPQCYTDYALAILLQGDIEKARELAEFAIELLEKDPEVAASKTSVLTLYYGTICPWINVHLSKTVDPLKKAFQSGVEDWDTVIGGAAGLLQLDHLQILGTTLSKCEHECEKQVECFNQLRWEHQLPYAEIRKNLVLELQGKEGINLESRLSELIEERNLTPVFLYHLNKVIFNFLMGDNAAAVSWAERGEPFSAACPGLIIVAELNFYQSLALLARYPNASSEEQAKIKQKVESNQQKLKQWAYHAPMNFRQKFLLVEAERHRYGLGDSPQRRQDDEAIVNYQQAIAFAQEQGFIQDVALASELAGEFFHKQGQLDAAERYLQDARLQYKTWGATAKVEQLEFKYPWLGSDSGLQVTASGSVQSSKDLSSPKNRTLIQFVDAARRLQINLHGCELNFLETQKALTIGYPDLDSLSSAAMNSPEQVAQAVQEVNPKIERVCFYSGSKLSHRPFWVKDYA